MRGAHGRRDSPGLVHGQQLLEEQLRLPRASLLGLRRRRGSADRPPACLDEWASTDGGALYARETLGVHVSPTGDDTRVRALGRSHGTGEKLLAVGDEFQQLRLLRYPCLSAPSDEDAAGRAVGGHAAPLSAVRFSFNDRYVLSAGGEDLSVFVWRVRTAPSALTAATGAGDGAAAETGATRGRPGGGAAVAGGGDAVDNTDDEEGEEDEEEDSDVESAVGFGAAPKDKPKSAEAAESDDDDDDDDVFVAEEPSAGEQLGALKPWHAAIKPPTNAPPPEEVDCSPPSEELELSWVYGFRGYDTRRVAAWVGRRAGGDGDVGGGGGAGGGAKMSIPQRPWWSCMIR